MSEKLKTINPNDYESTCLEALKGADYRITKGRRAVIQCLGSAEKPLSAPEVFQRLSTTKDGSSVDKVTVYRILDTLLELDLVHRTTPAGDYIACSHQNCVNTYHVLAHCTECKAVRELDVPNEVVAPLLYHLRTNLQFTPDSHLLQMEGLCSSCSSS